MREIDLAPHPYLAVGIVGGTVHVEPSPERLTALLRSPIRTPEPFESADPQQVYDAVRELLRHTGHKPSGRGKPASEYLGKTAEAEGGLRPINNIVDINNAVSLHTALPISVFDAGRLTGALRIAAGGPEESYVFNDSGQEISLNGLLTVYYRPEEAAEWIPAGNAVKDSMETKVSESTTDVLAVIYSHRQRISEEFLRSAVEWYRELLERYASATGLWTAVQVAPEGE